MQASTSMFGLPNSCLVDCGKLVFLWLVTHAVDSPVGSGLSYSTNPDQDYSTDDEQATDDLLEFLKQLMGQEFPDLMDRDLYIAGNS